MYVAAQEIYGCFGVLDFELDRGVRFVYSLNKFLERLLSCRPDQEDVIIKSRVTNVFVVDQGVYPVIVKGKVVKV